MRGLENTALGVLEIPRGMRVRTQEEIEEGTVVATAALDGAVIGGVAGTARAVGRMGSGLYDVLTFYLKAPGEYDSLMHPDSLLSSSYWEYQAQDSARGRTRHAPR